jgi:hypothetical protein
MVVNWSVWPTGREWKRDRRPQGIVREMVIIWIDRFSYFFQYWMGRRQDDVMFLKPGSCIRLLFFGVSFLDCLIMVKDGAFSMNFPERENCLV